jgi:L-lysine exporter family protein LysE/ArgO
MIFSAMFQGVVIGLGMIIPIGAQNAYVLGRGINRNHHLLAATLCIVCDISLIAVGIFGAGALINSSDLAMQLITWGGILFLLSYGMLSFKTVYQNKYQETETESLLKSRKVIVATTLAVTLLNPHVYLDTVMILGSVGAQFQGQTKIAYAAGTMLASIIWFYTLALGAAKMGPLLSQPKILRGIDFVVGCIMWAIAFSLYQHTIK